MENSKKGNKLLISFDKKFSKMSIIILINNYYNIFHSNKIAYNKYVMFIVHQFNF